MTNKHAKRLLINKYGCRCMLTGIKVDKLTYHHTTVKVEHGGKTSIQNGSNLSDEIHRWLHCAIEHKDKELYLLINECLQLYKECLDANNTELIEEYENEIMPLFREKIKRK